MKQHLSKLAAVLALSASAFASTFSVSGPGGAIPDYVATQTWNVSYAATPFTSTVTVANPVVSLTSVKIQGLTHTWRGDLHIFITDPNLVSYNIVVRPGSTGTSVGDQGDYLLGDYTFVETGGASVSQGTTHLNPGTFDQFFNTGTGMWTNGISNTPLSAISGPAGTWKLEIRDWAGLDTGSLTGWTLEGTDGPTAAFNAFCTNGSLGVDHTTGCPCGNTGLAGNGCGHSFDANGANLAATGSPALDTVVLHSSFEPVSSFTLMMQHANAGDSIFHDGVLCAANPLIRLRGRAAVAGEAFFPNSLFAQDSTTTLSVRGGTFPGSGQTMRYAAWYRNASSTFCPPATANVTNGWVIAW